MILRGTGGLIVQKDQVLSTFTIWQLYKNAWDFQRVKETSFFLFFCWDKIFAKVSKCEVLKTFFVSPWWFFCHPRTPYSIRSQVNVKQYLSDANTLSSLVITIESNHMSIDLWIQVQNVFGSVVITLVVNVLAALRYCLTFTWLLVEDGGLGWQINPQRAKIDFPLQNSSRIEEMVCTSTSSTA